MKIAKIRGLIDSVLTTLRNRSFIMIGIGTMVIVFGATTALLHWPATAAALQAAQMEADAEWASGKP
jgi:hypothetical protein